MPPEQDDETAAMLEWFDENRDALDAVVRRARQHGRIPTPKDIAKKMNADAAKKRAPEAAPPAEHTTDEDVI